MFHAVPQRIWTEIARKGGALAGDAGPRGPRRIESQEMVARGGIEPPTSAL